MTKAQDTESLDKIHLGHLTAEGGRWQRMGRLLRFLLLDAGLLKDPLVAYAVFSSLSRAGLIYSINETARTLAREPRTLVLLGVFAVASLVFSHLTRVRNHMIVETTKRDLRLALSRRLLTADIDFLLRKDKGQIYTVLTHEIQTVAAVAVNLVQSVEALLLLMICIPYLFFISWFIGFATLAAVGVGVLAYIVVDIPARRMVERATDSQARFVDRVNDMVYGWMELRLRQQRRRDLEEDIEGNIDEVKDRVITSEKYFSFGEGSGQLAIMIVLVAIVVLLPLLQGADATVMFQVLTVVLLTSGPIELIFQALPRLSVAVASQRKISDVVSGLTSSRSELASEGDFRPLARFETIEFRDVEVFVGEGGKPSGGNTGSEAFHLGPVSFRIDAREVTFITGGNGAGKSTLLALLCGLRRPDAGVILLDGKPVGRENIRQYRSLFSTVFSQFHLFSKTYGLSDSEVARLHDHIEALGLGNHVTLLERAFRSLSLSSGQRRRLALAVALCEQRPVVVLDEYAADQDPASRRFFYDTLIRRIAADGQAVVAVTHDDHNFSKCDHLIKLTSGRIEEDTRPGSPDRRLP